MGSQQIRAGLVPMAITLVLAAIFVLPATPTLAATRTGQTILGDVNGDGQITSADGLGILAAAIGKSLPDGWEAGVFGDTSCDARVTAKDALIALSHTVGKDVSAFCIGRDANLTCTDCHVNDTDLYAKQQEFALAKHGPGQFVYGRSDCAMCHTHLGFLERLQTGEWAYSAGTVPDSVPTNCRTCHQIHTTYTSADYAFTAEGIPVEFRLGGVTVDFGNATNLCASCHQARVRTGQMPVIDGDDLLFTSTHWGPHHGPQGNMFAGVGFYDFYGGFGGMSSHGTDSRSRGCPTCHMAESGSPTIGGHTFVPSTAGCETCHANTDNFDKFGGQTHVAALIQELGDLLETAGIVHFDGEKWHPVPGTYPANVAAAAWNLFGVVEDGSLGVHNPPYIIGILEGSIDEMGEVPAAYTAADGIAGGAAYSKWWTTGAGGVGTQPTTTAGKDFYRCKACHAWDGLGNAASYAARTGQSTLKASRPDVSSVNLRSSVEALNFEQMFALISRPGARDIDAMDSTHPDYSAVLSEGQIWSIVKFMREEWVDPADLYSIEVVGEEMYVDHTVDPPVVVAPVITYSNVGALGSAVAGETVYDSKCQGCHGADGTQLDIGGRSLGQHIRERPYMAWFMTKFGMDGTGMEPGLVTELTDLQDLYAALADSTNYPDR